MRICSPSAPALISIGVPAGVYLSAFSSRLHSTRSNSTASTCSSGRSGGSERANPMRIERSGHRSQRTADRPPRAAATAGSAAPGPIAAAPCRAGCSPASSCAAPPRASRSPPRPAGHRCRARPSPANRPCPPAPPAGCAGRARWRPAANCAAARIPSAPSCSAPRRHSGCAPARSRAARRRFPAAGAARGRPGAPGFRGSIASTPRMRIGAFSGRYRIGDAGSVLVPWPAASAWSNAHWAMPASMPAGNAGDGTGCVTRSLAVGHHQRGPGLELGLQEATQRSRRSARPSTRPTTRATSRTARCMRSSRSCATRAWNFKHGGHLADHQRHHQHHAEGQQVLHVADTLNEKRGGT